jgi:hypothetical protein
MIRLSGEKTGATGGENTHNMIGMQSSISDTATNAGASNLTNLELTSNMSAEAGETKVHGIVNRVTGIADDFVGYLSNVQDDRGPDIKLVSSANGSDYCTIETGADGATKITTVDASAKSAHFEIEADGSITLKSVVGLALEADTTITGGLTVDGDAVTFQSANADDPVVIIKNTTADGQGARLQLKKDRGAAMVNLDHIGEFDFIGENSSQVAQQYGKMIVQASEVSEGQEKGTMRFQVAEYDGTLTDGLTLTGQNADGEIDVTIGAGAASTSTVAGDLAVTTGLILDSVDVTTIQIGSEEFADNDTSLMTSAAIQDKIESDLGKPQTGKNYRIINTSFRKNIGTDKHYVPLKSQDEQTLLTREENTELAVCDGRLVSATVRMENMQTDPNEDFTLTIGVETNEVGTSYAGYSGTSETEAHTINTADDQNVFHFAFSNTKHWDATDMFAVSIQSSSDLEGDTDGWTTNERFFITLVVEDDWSTFLGTSSIANISSTP